MNSKNLQPALWGGLFMGVLSALPFVNLGNCLCCMWVIAGGVVAAYLLQKASPLAITVGDGAFVGLLAGLIGAVIGGVLGAIFNLITGPIFLEVFRRAAEQNPDMPPQVRDIFLNKRGGALLGLGVVFFAVSFCIHALFGTVGGMIGAALFKGGKPAVLPAEPPPPPMPPPQG